MDLVCPKCQASMRTYERNGVHVDQCADCRGIFLDRGELERLVDAENAWHGGAAVPPRGAATHQQGSSYPPASAQQRPHGQAESNASLGSVVSEVLGQVRGSSSHRSQSYGSKPRKKESFLGDLFG